MDLNNRQNMRLIEAILALKNTDEARRFLRDLMTEKEIEEFGKRLQTAEMLAAKVPYTVIEDKTGLSSTTVARVAHWLHHGMGGYRFILERLSR